MPRTSFARVAAPPLDERLMVERLAATCCFAFSRWRLARSKRRRGRRERRRRACAADRLASANLSAWRWLAGLALRSASFLFVCHRHSRRRQLARSSVRPSVRPCVRACVRSFVRSFVPATPPSSRRAFGSPSTRTCPKSRAAAISANLFRARPRSVGAVSHFRAPSRVRRPCVKPVEFRPRLASNRRGPRHEPRPCSPIGCRLLRGT